MSSTLKVSDSDQAKALTDKDSSASNSELADKSSFSENLSLSSEWSVHTSDLDTNFPSFSSESGSPPSKKAAKSKVPRRIVPERVGDVSDTAYSLEQSVKAGTSKTKEKSQSAPKPIQQQAAIGESIPMTQEDCFVLSSDGEPDNYHSEYMELMCKGRGSRIEKLNTAAEKLQVPLNKIMESVKSDYVIKCDDKVITETKKYALAVKKIAEDLMSQGQQLMEFSNSLFHQQVMIKALQEKDEETLLAVDIKQDPDEEDIPSGTIHNKNSLKEDLLSDDIDKRRLARLRERDPISFRIKNETKSSSDEETTDHVQKSGIEYPQKSAAKLKKKGGAFTCETCDDSFAKHDDFRAHVGKHLNLTFICECGFESHSEKSLKTHIANHGACYKCTLCNSSFTSKSSLRNHSRVHDGIIDTCTVPECGKKYSSRGAFLYHVQFGHKDKTIPCNFCGVMFATPSDAQSHEIKVHKKISQV